jgi:PIN domain nuclease of toxin-antitoxin system
MSYLLDTHVWIWSQESPEKLGPRATRALTDAKASLFVSTISTMEIARLAAVGLVEVGGPLDEWVSDTLRSLRCGTMEVSHEIALGAYALPGDFHKDPADRLLVSTARLERLVLLTADERILRYPAVRSLDARK